MDWQIIQKYFEDNENYITKHHLDAYNDFVRNKLPSTIKNIPIKVVRLDEQSNTVRHDISVHIGGEDGSAIFLSKPVYDEADGIRPLYPNDACVKNLYYASDLFANVTVKYKDYRTNTTESAVFDGVRIGTIPIMVNSCLCVLEGQPSSMVREMGGCPFDQGGYFIVDGKEKIIIAQERIVTNRLFISQPDPEKPDNKFSLEAQIQCTVENDPFKKTVMFYVNNTNQKRKNAVLVKITDIEIPDMPIVVAFRALGVESDRRILEYIVGDLNDPQNEEMLAFLYFTIIDNPNNIYTQHAAMEYLKEFTRFKNTDHVKNILVNDFLRNAGPHMRKKAIFLGMMVNKLVKTQIGILPLLNRDNFTHKRVDASGVLMYNLFRDFYNELRKDIRKQIERSYQLGAWYDKKDIVNMIKPSDIASIFNPSIIENGLKSALKGRWPGVETDPEKAGIVQDLNRISYVGYLSHVRRLNTPLSRELKIAGPRRLDTTQWGVACPYQSPDGASIGLDKHLSVLAHITIDAGADSIIECLKDLGCRPIDDRGLAAILNSTRVMLNNDIVAITDDPARLVDTIRVYRRNGIVNAFTSIYRNYYTNEIFVFTQSGRLMRPLLVVNESGRIGDRIDPDLEWFQLFNGTNGARDLHDTRYVKPTVPMEDLVKSQSRLEFIDVEESNNCLIAMTPSDIDAFPDKKYTHCEIHPSTALSLYTNTIPFGNHDQAPRIVFSGAQGKQAIGVYATNFNIRMDAMAYVLHYPQRPLVTTRYNKFSHTDSLPNGENIIVAVACFSGYNQEDAIIVNQSSVDRGMFNLTYFKSFIEQETNNVMQGKSSIFCNPHELDEKNVSIKLKRANILTVDENGMPKQNAYIGEDDLMMGKLAIATKTDNGKRVVELKDASKRADKTIDGIVDRTIVFKDEKGELNAKVRMRKFRVPRLGDKMASRHGQKGVCGMLFRHEDMPFTRQGIVPDIVINPHAFPTRMTIGHLMECIAAKAGALGGFVADGTIFEEQDIGGYGKVMESHGYERHGNEVMYNGFTGEQIETEIFIGPTMYFRLKHQASDKINYRSTGPVSVVTRQAVRGRADQGGLRVGEMETNAVLAHGLDGFLKETFIEKADGFSFDYNVVAKGDGRERRVIMPYSMKQLMLEVGSIGIGMNLLFDGGENEPCENGEGEDEGNIELPAELLDL